MEIRVNDKSTENAKTNLRLYLLF